MYETQSDGVSACGGRVQANYMLWRVVYGSVGMLTEDARDVQLEFSAKLTGQTQRKPRWKECLEGVMGR